MSSLRLAGLIVGLIGLALSFAAYRGPRWKKKSFVLSAFFSLSLSVVCLEPDVLNMVADMLKLEMEQRGRILALLIVSNIVLWFFSIAHKARFDDYRYQFDHLVRHLGYEEARQSFETQRPNPDIMIVIPAYNEEENLKILLGRIPQRIGGKNVGVLVVDDGSEDDTREVVRRAGHWVVRNPINRGQGAASRLGYDVLLKENIEVGVTMDADLQHAPEDIESLVSPILKDKLDLVIGARPWAAYTGSPLRKTGILFFTKVINALAGLNLTDCSSGFKAFKVRKMRELNLREDQFQSAEVLLEAAKKGLRIGETPITVLKRQHGTSKKGSDLVYGFNFSRAILKSWWR